MTLSRPDDSETTGPTAPDLAALTEWRDLVRSVRDDIGSIQSELADLRRDLFFDPTPGPQMQQRLQEAEQRLGGHASQLSDRETRAAATLDALVGRLAEAAEQVREQRARASEPQAELLARSVEAAREELSSEIARFHEAVEARLEAMDRTVAEAVGEKVERATAVLAGAASHVETIAQRAQTSELERLDALVDQLAAALHAELEGAQERIGEKVVWQFRERIAAVEQGLAARMAALDHRVRDQGTELPAGVAEEVAQRIDAAFGQAPERVVEDATDAAQDSRERVPVRHPLERAMGSLEDRVAGVLEQVVEATKATARKLGDVTRRSDRSLEAVTRRVDDVRGEVRSSIRGESARIDALERELRELRGQWKQGVEALLERLASSEKAVASAVSGLGRDLPKALTERVETLRGELPAVGAHVEAVRRDLNTEVGERLAAVERGVVDALRAELGAMRSDLGRQAAELREGMARVDQLGEAVSSIGRRRGFRKLASAERALHEQELSLVTSVRAELASLPASVEEQLKEALDRTRADLDTSIVDRLAHLPSLNGDMASLRKEVAELRKAVMGARSGEGSAQQIDAMERRLEDIQTWAEETLAKDIAARVRASLDRRLKALTETPRSQSQRQRRKS